VIIAGEVVSGGLNIAANRYSAKDLPNPAAESSAIEQLEGQQEGEARLEAQEARGVLSDAAKEEGKFSKKVSTLECAGLGVSAVTNMV